MLTSIDHIVLTTSKLDKTMLFYCDVLGMKLEEFIPHDDGELKKSQRFSNQKINLHHPSLPYKNAR